MAIASSDFQKIRRIVGEEVGRRTDPLNKDLSAVKKDVSKLKKGMVRLEKKMDYSIDFMDREYLGLKKRVRRVETELNIPAPVI